MKMLSIIPKLLGSICLCVAIQAEAAFILDVQDAPGEGFNDQTVVAPVGGNTATTLGQQRINAAQAALNLLDVIFQSDVDVIVGATFDPRGGSAFSAVLGSAGATNFARDFSGALLPNTFYAIGLANQLSGTDLSPGSNDITSSFNSDVDNQTVLGGVDWYYGLDQNSGSDIDFIETFLHEVMHGMGFASGVNLSTGAKLGGFDDAYMVLLRNVGAVPSDYPSMSDAQRIAASTDDGNLRWAGAGVNLNSNFLSVGVTGGQVLLYAPSTQEPGSSVSHFDTSLSPNEIMEPFATAVSNQVLAALLLGDIGWVLQSVGEADLNTALSVTSNAVSVGSSVTYTVNVTNPAGNDIASSVMSSSLLSSNAGTVSSIVSSQGTCSLPTRGDGLTEVLCSLGALVANTTATITYNVQLNTIGTVMNAASVSSLANDTVSADNASNQSVVVSGAAPVLQADLVINTLPSATQIEVDESLNYLVSIDNVGAASAANSDVVITLPTGLQATSVTPSVGSCVTASQVITCNLGTLVSAASEQITVAASASLLGNMSTTFVASTTSTENSTANNSNTINVLIVEDTAPGAPVAPPTSVAPAPAPVPASGGGGGGSMHWAFLLFAVLALVGLRRRDTISA